MILNVATCISVGGDAPPIVAVWITLQRRSLSFSAASARVQVLRVGWRLCGKRGSERLYIGGIDYYVKYGKLLLDIVSVFQIARKVTMKHRSGNLPREVL